MNLRHARPLFALVALGLAAGAEAAAPQVLRIGTTTGLITNKSDEQESTGRDTLVKFIKTETGFNSAIVPQMTYEQLAQKLDAGEVNVGVFQGFEFAWAKEKHPKLQALTVAVNVFPSRYVHVVTRSDNKATNFAGLAGQKLAVPTISQGYLDLFVNHEVGAQKDAKSFFAQITHPENYENAIDDVIDGNVQAAVIDRVALDAYKKRKPGRFSQLKEIAHSAALPAPVVAVREAGLDAETVTRFRDGLVNARKKSEGQRLLTLFRLTGFDLPPKDFAKQLADTRQTYPTPK